MDDYLRSVTATQVLLWVDHFRARGIEVSALTLNGILTKCGIHALPPQGAVALARNLGVRLEWFKNRFLTKEFASELGSHISRVIESVLQFIERAVFLSVGLFVLVIIVCIVCFSTVFRKGRKYAKRYVQAAADKRWGDINSPLVQEFARKLAELRRAGPVLIIGHSFGAMSVARVCRLLNVQDMPDVKVLLLGSPEHGEQGYEWDFCFPEDIVKELTEKQLNQKFLAEPRSVDAHAFEAYAELFRRE